MSWSLLEALGTPWAQGASGMGERCLWVQECWGSCLVGQSCRASRWGGRILAKRQGKQNRAPGASPGNLLPAAEGWVAHGSQAACPGWHW